MAIDDGLSHSIQQLTSPSDMVGPSPVTSNGTETTEIEDEASDEVTTEDQSSSPPTLSESSDSLATVSRTAQHWDTSY
jgi:hypothetical protein